MKGGGKGGGNGKCSGYVKSFNDTKGWGFIDMEGTDVFMLAKDCVDGRPVVGDSVYFDVEEDAVRAGQKKALNVTGCSGAESYKGNGKGCGKGSGGYGPDWSGGGWGGGWGCSPYGGGGCGTDWYGKGGKSGGGGGAYSPYGGGGYSGYGVYAG